MANNQNPQIISPAGIAKYPHLNVPDTKYDPNGVYQVKLVLSEQEAGGLKQQIDEQMQVAYQMAVHNAPPQMKPQIKMAEPPYRPVFNDNGQPTGELEFTFKMKAQGKRKDGSLFERKPALFDAKRQPVPEGVMIGGGSVIKVAATLAPFYTKMAGAGIALRLSAVQVIKLVQFGGGSADQFGFGEEDGEDLSQVQPQAPQQPQDNYGYDDGDIPFDGQMQGYGQPEGMPQMQQPVPQMQQQPPMNYGGDDYDF